MKHLREYALEYIIEKKTKLSDKENFSQEDLKMIHNFMSNLDSDESLADYVDQLNKMLADKDAKQILIKAFGKAKHGYKFKARGNKLQAIAVKKLHPTQSEIDIDKSLGFPFKHGVEVAKENGERYYGSKPVSMPFPLITFNGEHILDGHHRWSQTYAFNKDAKMMCLDIIISPKSDIKKIHEQDMLKITQGVLAAKRAEDGQNGGKIPKSSVEGANLFKMNEKQIRNKVNEYIKIDNGKPAQELAKAAKLKNVNQFTDLLTDNLLDLQKENKYYAHNGNNRGEMPQTDTGGDDMDKGSTAMPDVKGSALNKLITGTIDAKALNK